MARKKNKTVFSHVLSPRIGGVETKDGGRVSVGPVSSINTWLQTKNSGYVTSEIGKSWKVAIPRELT